MKKNASWPVVKEYDQQHLRRIALPLGGIGTGTISLGGRGDLRNWEMVNRPAKGWMPVGGAHFSVWAKPAGGKAVAKLMQGPIEEADYEGESGAPGHGHGFPRFRNCTFAAAYPFGQVLMDDPDMPIDVRLEAFNPLVPADADASGIPVAVLRYVLINKTSKPVKASVCGSIANFVGTDGSEGNSIDNVNTFRKTKGLQGVFMQSNGVPKDAEQYGTLALTTSAKGKATFWPNYADLPGNQFLAFWDDFSADGKLDRYKTRGAQQPQCFLTVPVNLPARGTKSVTFLLTWHFPNRKSWNSVKCDGESGQCVKTIGNYYTTQYKDAWDVAKKTFPKLAELEKKTEQFVSAVAESDLPHEVIDAALANISTLRTQTCFRTPDGLLFGFEGCCDRAGCCIGSCTHVWNYEQATAFLFGELAMSMRIVEFKHATAEDGLMSFRVSLPIEYAQQNRWAAADGQMGCIMKMYRDWQLSGDNKLLKELWPHVRKAVEFCWLPGGWDADRNGVMEGPQHNTMDVEYYGPNPQMGIWYLGALRAAEEMARHVGDIAFADKCRGLFEHGRKWIDANLFNGEYYEHEIHPIPGRIVEGTAPADSGGTKKMPEFQLGAGCLVDQLVGQYMAHICGLGYLVKKSNVRKTLRSIMKYNRRDSFYGHFNDMRSFVLNDEQALLMATYPRGKRPRQPFPYYNEVMTGFEYAAAVGMLQEGQTKNGLKCIKAVRDRYDGWKRSPFNEAECGHHYARAMASWAALLTLSGFRYSGVTKEITFAAPSGRKPVKWFWSNGYTWGTVTLAKKRRKINVRLDVLHCELKVKRLMLDGHGSKDFQRMRVVTAGRPLRVTV